MLQLYSFALVLFPILSVTMASTKSPTISIKLLIHNERNCVILAEVGNDFVDTLRSLLTFPLGNIARLVAKHQSLQPGCLNNLYNSVEDLSLDSFRTGACKSMLLSPRSIHNGKFKNLKLNMEEVAEPVKYFLCEDWDCRKKSVIYTISYSNNETSRCTCGKSMNLEASLVGVERDGLEDGTEGVSCKVETKFFITDDLRVMQGLPGGLVNFLLKSGIDSVNQIEEKVVQIGPEEMSNILSHSLVSKTTFTDVFLRKQGFQSRTMTLDERFMLIAPSKNERTKKDGDTSVNIVLRKSDRKILYAEASDDFVNLLFTFLTVPLESVLELLRSKGKLKVGSISNLFKDLDTIISVTKRNNSQNGVLPPFYSCPNELPDIRSRDPPAYYYYYNNGISWNLTYKETSSPAKRMDLKSPNLSTTNSSGYVEKNSLFVVTQDLVVKSLSSVSSISLLKELGIPLKDVEQQVVSIGEVEALALLRACLCSSSALSALLNVDVKQPKQEPL